MIIEKNRKLIISIALLMLILPYFVFGQNPEGIRLPGNITDMKDVGLKALSIIPDFLKAVWHSFLSLWTKFWIWLKNIWNFHIFPFLNNLWKNVVGKEIKERKPIIEEEFQKEKQEIKEEIKGNLPKGKSLWEKFKNLFK